MGVGAGHFGSPVGHRPRISFLPTTSLGWWAIGLAAAFFPLVFAATVVPRGAALGFVCGLATGVAALTAIVRDRERAVTVIAAVLPLAIAVAFVLAELISGSR
jgi:ABC-type Na+ efflux pump permease subunit